MQMKRDYFQIEQKGMPFDHDFCYSFSFLSPSFLGGKRKGEMNNQSRGQNSYLSARSYFIPPSNTSFLLKNSLSESTTHKFKRLSYSLNLKFFELFILYKFIILFQNTLFC